MGDSSSPPTPEQPGSVAATQQDYNTNSATQSQAGSNVNQYTPYGSLTYAQTGTGPGGVPLYTSTSSLSPQMQAIVSQLQGDVTGSLGKANYGSSDPTATIGNMTNGMVKEGLDQQLSYLKPYYDAQTSQLDSKLTNQGFTPGTPAYKQAMNNLTQSQNQGVNGYLAQIQPAAYQQATNEYLLPLKTASQEAGMLNNGATNATTGLVNPAQLKINPADYTGATSSYNDAQMKAYDAQMKQQTAMMSGLFGIPTAALGGWAKGGFAGLGGDAAAGGTAGDAAFADLAASALPEMFI